MTCTLRISIIHFHPTTLEEYNYKTKKDETSTLSEESHQEPNHPIIFMEMIKERILTLSVASPTFKGHLRWELRMF
jgi:hypothetical protein